jgi:hypothetical protein
MMPVSVCVAMTSTPGNTAPLWSLTAPLICAVAWPQTGAHITALPKKTVPRTIRTRFIAPPKLNGSQLSERPNYLYSVVNPIFCAAMICRSTLKVNEFWLLTDAISVLDLIVSILYVQPYIPGEMTLWPTQSR